MEDAKRIRLNIPQQDLAEFTLFPPNAAAALGWAQALPVANTDSVVNLLGEALSMLNRFSLSPEVRFDILEALQPNLEGALSSLSRRFLNQPLILPQEPRRMAEIGNRLYTLAGTAYTIVAIEAIQQRDSIRQTNPARLTCQALQRALVFNGERVLQAFLLFRPTDIRTWQTLHQLYQLAEHQGLADLPVPDARAGANTIRGSYLQTLLLSCCKPNNLRQNDLSMLHRVFRDWGEDVQLSGPLDGKGLFVVNLGSDQPPLYSSLLKEQAGPQWRYIDTSTLVESLRTKKTGAGDGSIPVDHNTSLQANLVDHLITSLGSTSLRNFNRTPSDATLSVCIGLSSTHYHVGGEKAFEQVLYGNDYVPDTLKRITGNRFLDPTSKGDMWQQANPETDYLRDAEVANRTPDADMEHRVDLDEATRTELLTDDIPDLVAAGQYPVFSVQLADASPGGYCLEWTTELPGDIRSGDIVGVKEERSKNWAIGVIRWLSQLDDTRTLVGLELLSPRAMPYGAAIHQKSGKKTPPMRVLLLPEIKLVGQPHTLITPRSSFRERQRVTLGNHSEKYTIQLEQQIASGGGFAQFNFRYVQELGDVLADNGNGKLDTDYDSLWSKI